MSDKLTTRIAELVGVLPDELVRQLAEAIEQAPDGDWQALRTHALETVNQPAVRKRVQRLLDVWFAEGQHIAPAGMALALRSAMRVEEHHRRHQQLELVWSGPDTQTIPLRRTDQALLQLVNEARERLHIVSFAVYKVPVIAAALVAAAERGVAICIYLETPDASEGKVAYDTVKALGQDVAQRAAIYVWPLEKRFQTPAGKHGSLHAKLAVADGNTLLISSANLTEYAMKLNMEAGILVRGGELPEKVEQLVQRLVEDGVFEKI